ncbi:MAG: hypothetical protein ACRDZN_04165 [Acidimicrobiales bacterium]
MAFMAALSSLTVLPAGAGDGTDEGTSNRRATASADGGSVTGTAEEDVRAIPANRGGNGGGPDCTRSDGTPDYLRHGPLLVTTMEEQRTIIRPEEQRPGEWLHLYCGDDWLDFVFLPEGQQVDPTSLARSVRITPPAPVLRTSPAAGNHLVDIEAWFWAENWRGLSEPATAGSVTVTVSAEPASLVVDPGDGSASFTCAGPQPVYNESLPSSAQSSDCTHTYTRAGSYTATATVVYDVSFTSNLGPSGDLGTIEPSSTTVLDVSEAQAINTGG